MKKPVLPANEAERLSALNSYNVLDSIEEVAFDDLTLLAAKICGTPISLISLVDMNRQWFKSNRGLNVKETPREVAFCAHAIHENNIFEIPNALLDERFSDNPLVINDPNVVFYAGAPLTTPEGLNVGTLCVIDNKPNKLNKDQQISLKALSRLVVAQLELGKKQNKLNVLNQTLKLNEDLVKENNAYLRNIMQFVPVGIIETDAFGNCNFVNDQWLNMTGLNANEALGDGWFKAVHPEDLLQVKKVCNYTIATQGMSELEYRFVKPNGEIIWVYGKKVSRLNDSGELVGFLGATQDITHQKNIALDLIKAKNEALAGTKAKSEFLANMSHEIRTPLNGVLGMANLLKDTALTDEQREYTSVIINSGNTLLLLINDILDFSKIEAGKLEIEYIECDLINYLNQITIPFKFIAKQKGISFKFIPEVISQKIFTDPSRFGQIASNLISNAIKFTNTGEVVLKLSSQKVDDTKIKITMCVEDSGIGIREESQALLFKSFSQAELSTNRKFGGTGLGLSITKELVELMNGRIWYESELGKGSKFYVELILKTGAIVEPVTNVVEKSSIPINQVMLSGNILVAEDNKTNQLVIGRMLQKLGLTIKFVENGIEAIEELTKNTTYNLVLMDCQMPEMDGYEATRLIRLNGGSYKDIPIIALTANASKGERESCIELGMNEFLTKPIDPELLLDVLRKFLAT